MFDQQPQEIPNLISHLQSEYAMQVGGAEASAADPFVAWALDYLNTNRPVENFPVDHNHGVRLTNNVRVLVCPGEDLRGTTTDAGAVGITTGESQKGQEGVSDAGGHRVI